MIFLLLSIFCLCYFSERSAWLTAMLWLSMFFFILMPEYLPDFIQEFIQYTMREWEVFRNGEG